MAVANTLAYYNMTTITAVKKFYGTSPRCQACKLFLCRCPARISELECFSLASFYSTLIFASKARVDHDVVLLLRVGS